MASLDDLLRRVAHDPAFRRRLRDDPVDALRGHHLTAEELRQLDVAVRAEA